MNAQDKKVVDIDIGRPQYGRHESPTFRLHFHNFAGARYSAESQRFACFGHLWKVRIWPNVPENDVWGNGYISLDLTMVEEDDDWESDSDSDASDASEQEGIRVRFAAFVRDLEGKVLGRREKTHQFTYFDDEKGFRQFIERSVVGGGNVLRDGTLTVELQMKVLKRKQTNPPCPPFVPPNPLTQNIKKLFLDEKTADVLFAVRKEEGDEVTNIFAHRFVLQVNAQNLAAFCDSSNNSGPISISRVDPRVFTLLLFYVYGGSISDGHWNEHKVELLDAADLYGIVSLKLEAEAKYVASTTVTIDNAMELLAYADSRNCMQLKETVLDFVVRNKADVLKQVASSKNVPQSSTMFTDLLAAMARGDKASDGDSGEESVDTLRVGDLRRRLHEKGLDVDGSRETLIARLKRSSKKSSGKKRKRSPQQDAVVEIE